VEIFLLAIHYRMAGWFRGSTEPGEVHPFRTTHVLSPRQILNWHE